MPTNVMKAVWNNVVLAESDNIVEVEGNLYFPMKSIKNEFFKDSDSTSLCVWKGKAKYLTVFVDGKENRDCAWYYPNPSFLAKKIKDRIAFWKGVQIMP